jgi:hypothetical protein
VLFGTRYVICGTAGGYVIWGGGGGCGRLVWRNDMTGIRQELGLGYFGRLAMERAKGRMKSICGEGELIAWCG